MLINSQPLATDAPVSAAPAPMFQTRMLMAAVSPTSQYVPRPTIVTRAQWGAYAPDYADLSNDTTIYGIVVHHTAGSNNYTPADVPSILRGIQSYHEYTLGWADIGYNFLVDKFGTIYEGRAGGVELPTHGAHATSWNTNTVGVSVMMNSGDGGADPRVDPSPAVISSLARIIAWKLAGNYRDPLGRVTLAGKTVNVIFRHGDVMATSCPGLGITAQMDNLRNQVATMMSGTANTEIKQYWLSQGGDASWLGSPYRLEDNLPGGIPGRHTVFAHGQVIYTPSQGIHVVHGAILNTWVGLGGETGTLGLPQTDEIPVGSGVYQVFAGGRVGWTPDAGAHMVRAGMISVYDSIGGERGTLGLPTSDEIVSGNSVYQHFERGDIVWNDTAPSLWVLGAIANAYRSAGAENGVLGLPTSNEIATSTGTYQNFQGGVIYWTAATNATQIIVVPPAPATPAPLTPFAASVVPLAIAAAKQFQVPASVSIAQAILESGAGSSTLSVYGQAYFGIKCSASTSPYAVGCINLSSAEYVDPNTAVNVTSAFRIYQSASASFLDHGYFLRNSPRYASAFNDTSHPDRFITDVANAGYATDPVYAAKVITLMRTYNLYQFDQSNASAPAVVPQWGIGGEYAATGGAVGPLGIAIGAEQDGPFDGSRMVTFDKGIILWSASTGAHAIFGKSWDEYRLNAGIRAHFGLPRNDAQTVAAGGWQTFQGGQTSWLNDGSRFHVFGAILNTYLTAGGATSYLGFPTSNEIPTANGVYQNYQHGRIYWSLATGTRIG